MFYADLNGSAAAEEWRGSWAIALLYRRPGIALAWCAAQIGLAPTTITLVGLALAVTMPVQAWLWPLSLAPWAVALSGVLFQMFDCADGTLARLTGQASTRGADLDFLTDMAQWALLYLSIGILADRASGGDVYWAAFALGAAWMRLMARVVRDRLATPESDDKASDYTGSDNSGALQSLRAIDYPVVFVAGLSGLLPFLALSGDALPWAVVFLIFYALLDLGDAALPLFRR